MVFWIFSGVAVGSALLCITRRSPIASALWLVQTMFALAALYVLLDAQFIAALQIMVYAGAVMVLFLFVIMLLNLGSHTPRDWRGIPGWVLGFGMAAVLAAELFAVRHVTPDAGLALPPGALRELTAREGIVRVVAEPLYREYLVAFEVTGVLLLVATVGAIVLAKRRL